MGTGRVYPAWVPRPAISPNCAADHIQTGGFSDLPGRQAIASQIHDDSIKMRGGNPGYALPVPVSNPGGLNRRLGVWHELVEGCSGIHREE